MKCLLRVGTVLLAFTAAMFQPMWLRAEEEAVPTDRLLPPDVALYVSVPDVNELKTRFGNTAMSDVLGDSAFEPFKQEINKVLEHFSSELQENLGVPLKDLLALPEGEVAFAVLAPPGKKLAAALFLNFGDNETTVNTLMEKAEKALAEHGAESDDEEIDGVKVTVWTFKKNEGDDQKPNNLVYFIEDDVLVATSDLETAKGILARWDGKHEDTFADKDNYNLILEKCSTDDNDGVFVWFADPMTLVKSAMAQAAASNPQVGLMVGFMEPLGVNSLKAVGGSFDLGTEQFDSVSKTYLIIDQPTKGLLNLFQFPAIEQKPPRWATTNSSGWFSLNWDIGAAYKAIETMVDMFRGPGQLAAIIDQLAENEGGPKVHIKKDIIDVIGGRIQVVMHPGKKQGNEPADDQVIVSVSLKDAKKFAGTLAKIAKMPGFEGKSRDFKGTTIFEFEVPDFTGSGSPKDAGLAVGQDQLLFSNDVTTLEAMLRGDTDGEALADSAPFKKIAELLPAKTSIVSFSRSDSQLETLWNGAREGQLGAAFPQIDFSKLPDFDSIRKYLQPSAGYSVPDQKGVSFVTFSTKKK